MVERVVRGTVIADLVLGTRVTDGRLEGVSVLTDSRTAREVTGFLITFERTVVGRLGAIKRFGLVGNVYGRLKAGCRTGVGRVVPKVRFVVGLEAGRRVLVLSACVGLGWQLIAATRLRVSRCLVTRIMVWLLVSVSV